MARPEPGTLIVIPTPIGNLEDMTYRGVRVLQELGALACEDTRHTRRVFERYGPTATTSVSAATPACRGSAIQVNS